MKKVEEKLEIWDVLLHNISTTGYVGRDSYTNQEFADIKESPLSYRIVGTLKQLQNNKPQEWSIDEVYRYEQFELGTSEAEYYKGICWSDNPQSQLKSLEEWNKTWQEKMDRYRIKWIENKKELVIIQTI